MREKIQHHCTSVTKTAQVIYLESYKIINYFYGISLLQYYLCFSRYQRSKVLEQSLRLFFQSQIAIVFSDLFVDDDSIWRLVASLCKCTQLMSKWLSWNHCPCILKMRLRQWLTGEWCPLNVAGGQNGRFDLVVNVMDVVLVSACWALSLNWSKWSWFWADWRLWGRRGFRSTRSLQRIFSLLWTKRAYVTDHQTLLLQIVCYLLTLL